MLVRVVWNVNKVVGVGWCNNPECKVALAVHDWGWCNASECRVPLAVYGDGGEGEGGWRRVGEKGYMPKYYALLD